jgi:hypothetical protein
VDCGELAPMACPAERGRVTRGSSPSNSEPKSKNSDKGTHVRSAGNFGPKPPHVHSSPRAPPRVELVRPGPEGPQPQLLGDTGQLAVPSMLRRRAQTPYNDSGTH